MKKTLLLFAIFLMSCGAFAQSLYDLNTIQDIRVFFPNTSWDSMMDTAIAGSEGYIVADSVFVNSVKFIGCGVKYKGNSSYSATRAKNPLHIKLDYTSNQDYQGYQDLKLANGFSDPSFIREPSSYLMLRQYMSAPLSNFAKVYINNAYYGIMTNDEDISNRFLEQNYFSSCHTLIKCNPQNAGPGSGTGSSLAYAGVDSTSTNYTSMYEVKSDYGWTDLIHFCDTLNNSSASINSVLDVDRALWMLAFNDVLVNLDSYSGSFRQNYYLYRDHANQWIPTVWDVNMSYGSFTMSGTGQGLNLSSMQTLTPLLHATESAWPLIYKLLANAQYKKMYIAHMRTINQENFLGAQYKPAIVAMRALIDNAVSTDPNFLYSYTQFQSNLTTTITGGGGQGGGGTCGVYELMDTRAAWLNTCTEFSQVPPTIASVTPSSSTPAFGSNAAITAQVTNATSVYLGSRSKVSDRFVRIAMLDDGNHNDGAAGDLVFGANMPVNSLNIQYYVYAENANAGLFSPVRAEHEFYQLNPTITQATTADLVINEVLAANTSGIVNESGKNKDWLELYNKTNNTLGLNAIFLSDSLSNIGKWRFPADAFIGPNEHLLVWADDKNVTLLDHHTNFDLNNAFDMVLLSDSLMIGDSLSFLNQPANQGLARCPDGTGDFQPTTTLTPKAVNICELNLLDEEVPFSISLSPNPTTGMVNLAFQGDLIPQSIQLVNMRGPVVLEGNGSSRQLDLTDLASGLYVARVSLVGRRPLFVKIVRQ